METTARPTETDSEERPSRKETQEFVDVILDCKMEYKESQHLYSQWARSGKYDQMLKSQQTVYAGPFVMKAMMKRLFPTPNDGTVLLDLGAGTGNVAADLKSVGFTTIDALEPCADFVGILQKTDQYRNILEQFIGGGSQVQAEDDTYDAVVTVGTFCPGHIPCDALHEIIRIIKPGGYFVNCMRESFMADVPEYSGRLEPLMKQLEEQGKWRKVAWDRYDNHFLQSPGICMVFQIC